MKTKFNYIILLLAAMSIVRPGRTQEMTLSLEQALRLAKENNKTLQVQHMEEKVADASIKEARSAMLPSVSAHGNYSYYFDRQVIFMPGSFTGNESEPVVDVAVGGTNAFSTNVYLQQAIVNEAARKQIKSMKLEAAIQSQETRDMESDLAVRISENYFTIQLLQTSIELHQQSRARNERALADSRSLYHQGKALKVDTLRTYIAVENLNSTISYLNSRLEVHLMQLKNDLGIPSTSIINVSDSLYLDEAQMAHFISYDDDGLSARPDIQQGRLSINLHKNYLEQSRAMRLPVVSFIGSYQLQAQSDDRRFSEYSWPRTSFVGLQASVPIFTGNKINAKINQSQWRLRQSETNLQNLYDNARTEKAMLENELSEAIKQVTIQQKTVEAATLSYNMISDRYQNGLSSRLELSDAELALTEAKMNQLNSVYRVKITRLKLNKAMGTLQL